MLTTIEMIIRVRSVNYTNTLTAFDTFGVFGVAVHLNVNLRQTACATQE